MSEIKTLSVNEKIEYLKKYLTTENIEATEEAVLNIFVLLKRYNTFNSDFFAHKDVLFNDYMESIDILQAVTTELTMIANKLLSIYMSCIKHCKMTNINEKPVHIPDIYLKVLKLLDFHTMSVLFGLYPDYEETKDIYFEATALI